MTPAHPDSVAHHQTSSIVERPSPLICKVRLAARSRHLSKLPHQPHNSLFSTCHVKSAHHNRHCVRTLHLPATRSAHIHDAIQHTIPNPRHDLAQPSLVARIIGPLELIFSSHVTTSVIRPRALSSNDLRSSENCNSAAWSRVLHSLMASHSALRKRWHLPSSRIRPSGSSNMEFGMRLSRRAWWESSSQRMWRRRFRLKMSGGGAERQRGIVVRRRRRRCWER